MRGRKREREREREKKKQDERSAQCGGSELNGYASDGDPSFQCSETDTTAVENADGGAVTVIQWKAAEGKKKKGAKRLSWN